MSDEAIPDRTRLPLDVLDRIDRACDRLEAAWARGERPRIEDAIGEVDAPYRRALLRDLLAAEIAARRRVGECPEPADYRDRAGLDALAVDSAFGAAGVDADATVERIPDDPTVSVHRPIAEGPGTTIGPYKLLQQIGEGGMGTVFMAEQERPVRRKVALKVIKPGMDTGQVIARFEAERQALAMMDHANIARVLDAGATETGRPYFVMELVKGVPITEYCDRNQLTPKQRLELFIPVCQAIQHAHQKGIIHRDIKPSNVLVALYDGVPVPKVIDFGVAKAIDQRLTERTMFTEFGAIIGTLEYMSPEQAEMGALDIDTRSDIYSLGVLLYELLTGSTPLERAKLFRVAYSEILKRIREEDPPKPSTRLSESKDALPSISAQRRMEPARLTRLVRGDLDWIVMKSLEKDLTRRYETATGFARDIQRYLDGDAVEACPPSASYKFRKFARKHRVALVTAGAFAMLLVAASVISATFAVTADRARQSAQKAEARATTQLNRALTAEAKTSDALAETTKAKSASELALKDAQAAKDEAEAISSYLIDVFRKPDPDNDGRQIKVVDVLDQAVARLDTDFTGSQALKGAFLNALGRTYLGLGVPENAVDVLTKAVAVREATLGRGDRLSIASRGNLALAYDSAGNTDKAIELSESTLDLAVRHLGPRDAMTLTTRFNLAETHRLAGHLARAITLHEETLKLQEARLGHDHVDCLQTRDSLAAAYRAVGRADEAILVHQATLKILEAKYGPNNTRTMECRSKLALAFLVAKRTNEAIVVLEALLKIMEARLDPEHPDLLMTRNNLGAAYLEVGRLDEAVAVDEANLKVTERKLGPDHRDTLLIRYNLAVTSARAGRNAEAIRRYEVILPKFRTVFGLDHHGTISLINNLSEAYETLDRWADAEPLRRELVELLRKSTRPDAPPTLAKAQGLLGHVLAKQLKWTEAERFFRDRLRYYEKARPEDPITFNARMMVAACLFRQKKYAEAEPLFVSGYEGLKARKAKLPPAESAATLAEAGDHILQLYEAWGKPEKAAEWRAKLGIAKPELPRNVFARPR